MFWKWLKTYRPFLWNISYITSGSNRCGKRISHHSSMGGGVIIVLNDLVITSTWVCLPFCSFRLNIVNPPVSNTNITSTNSAQDLEVTRHTSYVLSCILVSKNVNKWERKKSDHSMHIRVYEYCRRRRGFKLSTIPGGKHK